MEDDDAKVMLEEILRRLPEDMRQQINESRTLRLNRVFNKTLEIHFNEGGLNKARGIKVKDMIADIMKTRNRVPAGAYPVLQPEPEKQKEFSVGGRLRGYLEEAGVPASQLRMEWSYKKKGNVAIFWKPPARICEVYGTSIKSPAKLFAAFEGCMWPFTSEYSDICAALGLDEEQVKATAAGIC